MKVRLIVPNEKRTEIENKLLKSDIEINDVDFDYTLSYNHFNLDKIVGLKDSEIFILKQEDILYFESQNNDVFCHTIFNVYLVKYRIYELASYLAENEFMRISHSHIVHLEHINSIIPTMNRKFILRLSNDEKIDVTRSYYYQFKEFIEKRRLK